MKYHIQSFGCQMNVYDAKSLMGLLNSAGHEFTANLDEAEMILLNTCAIREGAEERVRGRIGQLKRLKKKGTLRYLGVCGCMGQKEGARLTDSVPHLDLVMGPGAIGHVVNLVDRLQQGERPLVDLTGIDDDFDEIPPLETGEVTYPRFVSIMRGCDKRCTYCIVPYTRGGERSRDPHVILQEAESLVQKGFKEITLIGQTVNSYTSHGVDFPRLLEMADAIPGIERIRFATSHPASASPEMFEAMARLPHVCEQLHLPVQAGSNRTLERMERGYTREEYLEKIAYFKRLFEGSPVPFSITTDIIVGFPGETEDEFEETLDLMREVRFDAAFMFKFSPRRGTPAAEMPNPVDDITKSRRLDRLIQLQQAIAHEQNQDFLGKTVEVMIERVGDSPRHGTVYEARMRTGRIVKLYHSPGRWAVGDFVEVSVTQCTSYALYGEPVKEGRKNHVA